MKNNENILQNMYQKYTCILKLQTSMNLVCRHVIGMKTGPEPSLRQNKHVCIYFTKIEQNINVFPVDSEIHLQSANGGEN